MGWESKTERHWSCAMNWPMIEWYLLFLTNLQQVFQWPEIYHCDETLNICGGGSHFINVQEHYVREPQIILSCCVQNPPFVAALEHLVPLVVMALHWSFGATLCISQKLLLGSAGSLQRVPLLVMLSQRLTVGSFVMWK